MARESSLWRKLKEKMEAPDVDLTRVENPVGPGTPDVNYSIAGVDGWIELKEIDDWPRRPDTPVRIPHFRPEQRLWIRKRARAGGRVFVFIRVNSTMTYMLFPGEWAWQYLGEVGKFELRKRALCCWNGEFDEVWLRDTLVK